MEEMYYYWLHNTEGVGRKTLGRILTVMTPKEIYEQGTEKLKHILSESKRLKIEERRKEENLILPFEQLKVNKINLLYYGGSNYPAKLMNIPDPPIILYEKGNPTWREKATAAVVGTRACSAYGKQAALELGRILSQYDIAVISGMARGIDGICQWSALENKGISVGVLGCGIQVCYPPEHHLLYQRLEKEGALLSESTPYTKPAAGLFPERNRIISGLADVVVVVEARQKSGTLITVDMALDQGKEVYCIPGRITDIPSSGCNRLIKQGAEIILSIEDFAKELQEKFKEKIRNTPYHQPLYTCEITKKDDLTKSILQCVDSSPVHYEEIALRLQEKKIKIERAVLMQHLLDLQISGEIKGKGQNYYYLSAVR